MTKPTEIQDQIDRIWESVDKDKLKGDMKHVFGLGFYQAKTMCVFCGKSEVEVNEIVYGDNGCICNECTVTCIEVMIGKKEKEKEEQDEQEEERP